MNEKGEYMLLILDYMTQSRKLTNDIFHIDLAWLGSSGS